MKHAIIFLLVVLGISACHSDQKILIDANYLQNEMKTNSVSKYEKSVQEDLVFWKRRADADSEGTTNFKKYASSLVARFRLYGDISDLKQAESIISRINNETHNSESGNLRTLGHVVSLQHRFSETDTMLTKALKNGDNKYESMLMKFDVAFELGRISEANRLLTFIKKPHEYAYYFRLAKMQHYDGDMDKAIESMQEAADLSFGNVYLKQAALSNLADLQMHIGAFEAAANNYKTSYEIDHSDLHSLKGMALVAAFHDKNYALAETVLKYIADKTCSPDVYFNLSQLYQLTGNKKLEKEYATQFAEIASQPVYGNMYNKYLIQLYDGVLNNPKAMLEVANNEIKNRNTPQTNSWYAWALYQNNQAALAMQVYKKHVSEQPLEGLELYYMGKLMKAENKSINANAFFKAAYKNRFELAPNYKSDLEKLVNS